jgi:adenylate kinase family enzyme
MIGVILIGQSNSGKSVLGKTVAERLGIRYISSGDIARSMSDIKVQKDLNSGKLAPEDKMRSEIVRNIALCNIPYILDGFPRFYEQYEWINQTIAHNLIYVYIDVPDEDVISRAKSRNRCDDKSIKEKIRFFKENTELMMQEIFIDEDVYIIDNSNGTSIEDNINKLSKIVEEHINADNSKV